ncbi:MAG: hypothetical protein ACT443_14150 [Gemmatimonadota bacterium]
MPTATKIVIHFDDGTTFEVQASKVGSLFTSEARAKKCGHNPPYGKPPREENTATTMDNTDEGGCYWIDGVIVCP